MSPHVSNITILTEPQFILYIFPKILIKILIKS